MGNGVVEGVAQDVEEWEWEGEAGMSITLWGYIGQDTDMKPHRQMGSDRW